MGMDSAGRDREAKCRRSKVVQALEGVVWSCPLTSTTNYIHETRNNERKSIARKEYSNKFILIAQQLY